MIVWPNNPLLKRIAMKAYIGLPFTIEELAIPSNHHLVALVRTLAERGLIEKAGERRSARQAARQRRVTTWRGTEKTLLGYLPEMNDLIERAEKAAPAA